MLDFNTVSFFKLYFIDYAIIVAPILPPLPSSIRHLQLPQAIPPPLFMSIGHEFKFFGYSIFYTVLDTQMTIL